MKRRPISIPSILFALVMLLVGVVLVLLTSGSTSPAADLLQRVGFAFIVTGVVVVFQESVIARFRADDTDQRFADLHERIDSVGSKIDLCFRHFEESYGTKALAIRLIALKRLGYDNYHHWLVHTTPEDLFFAGHSVLHRVQIDMDRRGLGKLPDTLVKKISAGSKMRVLFLDPSWDFIQKIAEGENQTLEKMMTDLAITLGICRRLWTTLDAQETVGFPGSIEIRMCKEVQQYAFHSVTDRESGNVDMLVGLYFAKRVGLDSPLFAVEHKDMQDIFAAHFSNIFERASRLLEYSPPIKHFDHDLYRHNRAVLSSVVDRALLDQHCQQ